MLRDLAAHPWPVRRLGTDVALALGCYAVLGFLAIVVARQPGSIATIWFANGAAIALIVSAPRVRRPALLAAGAVGNLLANLLYGDTLGLSLAFLPPNAIEVALGAFLVTRTGRAERFANDQSSFLRVLVAGAFVPPIAGATVGALTLQALGFASFLDVWVDWYIGATLGGVAMLPLVLAARAASFRSTLGRLVNPVNLLSVVFVSAAMLASLKWMPYPFVTVGVVLMVFAFLRPRLATFVNAPVVVASLAVALGIGWYVPAVASSQLGHALVFLAALLVVVPAQVVSVVVARQRTLSDMLSAVGSRVDDILVFVDMSGTYRWVNRAREIYWGESNDRVLGRSWAENMPAEPYESVVRPLFEQARAGQVARRIVDFDYPVRGRRTIDMHMQPALDEEGHQIGVLYCGTDVTDLETSRRDLQRTADELTSANRSLEQFVRISSHDLREPLNTIVQFCNLISSEHAARLDDSGRLYFSQVSAGAARMKSMLDDVLAFVRLDEASARVPERVDLDRLAQEVRVALTAQIQNAGAQVEIGPLGSVTSQATLLSLALQNLVSNALKFMPPGRSPVVRIVADRSGGELRLSVADNGIGIDPGRIEELGTPFRRLHSRRKYEGTGLGLAICRRIAEQLGGRLEIESAPGQGSVFTVVICGVD